MSWKLLSTLRKAPVPGSKTEAWLKVGPAGKESISVEDQVSTRPSGRLAAEIAISGHGITGPHSPNADRSARTKLSWPFAGIGWYAGLPVRYPTSRTSPPVFSKNSTRRVCAPAVRFTVLAMTRGPCRPSLSTTRLPSMYRRDPSSELVKNS
jgi:hypothetical protein